MKRVHRKAVNPDFTIMGDEVEHHRIQLEQNLQHTDLSLQLSNTPESVEYPRFDPGPSPFPDFPSIYHPDHFDAEGHSNLHAWSFRTGEDEEGINPYTGETISTAAHHASALTFTAGLGGRGARRDVSLSNAEYDPDRPLHEMIAGVDSNLSIFDTGSKSKYAAANSIGFDPLVVDDTAELDRVLQSGLPPDANIPLRSHSSGSSSDSDSSQVSSRPKLSDALRRVSFSPMRPRSAQSHLPQSATSSTSHRPQSALAQASALGANEPTPRAKNNFPSRSSSHPIVRLQPPTPSTSSSKFSKMAKGISREIHAETAKWAVRTSTPEKRDGSIQKDPSNANNLSRCSRLKPERNPFTELAKYHDPNYDMTQHPATKRKSQTTSTGKVYLPDITGLTSAVDSPAKPILDYHEYQGNNMPKESDALLLSAITTLQNKLVDLESENSISRRRVRELELELEQCKREVARERTRVMRAEELVLQQSPGATRYSHSAAKKGKARAREGELEAMERYKEVVDEKKALETLIGTLRTHLERLTAELASHKQLLTELRTLRELDSAALNEKSREVDRLREELERLAGEVEVLRGVVEEGLKERRLVREQTGSSSRVGGGSVQGIEAEDANNAVSKEEMSIHPVIVESEGEDELEDSLEHLSVRRSPTMLSRASADVAMPDMSIDLNLRTSGAARAPRRDRTMHTNQATLGSSMNSGHFINDDHMERVSAEVEERRSNQSRSVRTHSASQHSSVWGERSQAGSPLRTSRLEDTSDDEHVLPSQSPGSEQNRQREWRHTQEQHPRATPRPAGPATRRIARHHRAPEPNEDDLSSEAPFPRIRGGYLERLFFSTSDHNAKTCTVCHRRRVSCDSRATAPHDPIDLMNGNQSDNEDEGFVEGPDDAANQGRAGPSQAHKGQKHGINPPKSSGDRHGLPPQTVLARVLRELEDDFTHYKGIYIELADQYKVLDAASDVRKRRILAQHLHDVIDLLEQKGDHIASLYELLTFGDKPVSESVVHPDTP